MSTTPRPDLDNQSDNFQKARMLAGELYRASEPQLVADQQRAQRLLRRFNDLDGERIDEQHQVLRELLGSIGEGSVIKPTFACDYGYNIRVGRQSFINYHRPTPRQRWRARPPNGGRVFSAMTP